MAKTVQARLPEAHNELALDRVRCIVRPEIGDDEYEHLRFMLHNKASVREISEHRKRLKSP